MSSSSPPPKPSPPGAGPADATRPATGDSLEISIGEAHSLGQAHTMGVGDTMASVGPSIPPLGSRVSFQVTPGSLELVPGTVIHEYRLEGKLGEGGMGQVFAATHPIIGKRAAIKVIRIDLCSNPEAVERFVQEARAVNQIGHPNIVDVFAFGTLPDGRRYLVMEWLKGESLGQRIKREALPVSEVCDILDPVCRALEAAHEKRIIHRDLKPDNVFLMSVKGEKPIVKLLDFGIAKLVGTDDTRLERTRTGSLLGTPQYISPEQARGRDVDERTDIYALGVMAFEMFTGRPPFMADNAMDMISSHLHDPPPSPSSVSPEMPPLLDSLLLSMLSKEPAGRPSLARVRETLIEVRKAPSSMRATVRAAPPQVQHGAPPGSPRAQTLQMPSPGPVITEVAAPPRRGRAWIVVGSLLVLGGVAAAAFAGVFGEATAPKPPVVLETPPPARVPELAPVAPVLPPPPAPVAAPATLVVEVNVPDATVEVAGQRVLAAGGTARLEVPAGPAELKVSAPGRKPVTRNVDLRAGQEQTVKLRLERERATGGGKPTVTPTPATPPPTPVQPAEPAPVKPKLDKPADPDGTIW